MKYRPNSNPENFAGIIAESAILSLPEHCVLTSAINPWDGPNYATNSTYEARLRSSVIYDCPHGLNPGTNTLSDAGFFLHR